MPTVIASLAPLLLLLLLLLCSSFANVHARSSAENAKRIVDKLLTNYTRQMSPNGDFPTNVYIGIYIIGFYSISESTMDYALTMYLRQQWIDPRLKFNSSLVGGRNKIRLEDSIWDKIWVPDVFLRNEKKADFHSVTIPNRFMNLESNGQIWYVIKLSVTLSCGMKLHKYPLDTQLCPMMFESFGYTMDTVVFEWLQKPKIAVELPEGLFMPQFHIKKAHRKSCNMNYTTGAYPCLQIDFELERAFGYFAAQIYIPTVLIVILSWFAFWLNIDAVPARVSLGLLTVLTITTQASGSKSSLPKVSYIKAIDVWMSVCLGFVFASLLEFAIVNVYSRRDQNAADAKKKKKLRSSTGLPSSSSATTAATAALAAAKLRAKVLGRRKSGGHRFSASRPESPVFVRDCKVLHCADAAETEKGGETAAEHEELISAGGGSEGRRLRRRRELPSIAKRIDKFSRRAFPMAFLLFNVVYWVYYVIIA